MFDPKGDRSSGWGIGTSRGPLYHLQKYYPPLRWNGYGLRVKIIYDNGDDTWLVYSNVEGNWYIAYHGGIDIPKKKCLRMDFKQEVVNKFINIKII